MDPVTATAYPLPDALLRVLTPAEDISVSHWCDRHRYLTRRFAAEPGPWRTSKTPYLREPLDAFADATVESIMFVKCARVGGTEWVNNILGYTADARPMPVGTRSLGRREGSAMGPILIGLTLVPAAVQAPQMPLRLVW